MASGVTATKRRARCRWRFLRRPTDPRLAFAVGTIIAFLVGWNADIADPATGETGGWQAGLYMATKQGLHFGQEIAFTYGPLGFLKFPTSYDTLMMTMSVGYVLSVQLLTAALLVWTAYTVFRQWTYAVIVAAIATSIMADWNTLDTGGAAPVGVLAFVASARAMRSDAPAWLRTGLATVGGSLAGLETLGKLNLGVMVVSMVLLAVLVCGGPRRIGLFAATFLSTTASGWFLTGQSVGNLDDYIRMSLEVLRTFPAVEGRTTTLSLPLALLILGAATILLGASWLTARNEAGRTRVAVFILSLFFLASTFKYAFVTGFSTHYFIFFTTTVGAWFAFKWANRRVALSAFAALVAMYFLLVALEPQGQHESTVTNVVGVNPLNQRPTSLLDTSSPQAGRTRLRGTYHVSPTALRLIDDRPIHISSDETSVAWAYELHWTPLPVFHRRHASASPELDRLNARFLGSPDGPARILRERGEGDALTYPPATLVTMICRFRHLYKDSRWQVLGRVRNRCGRRHRIKRITLPPAATLSVPHPKGTIILASIQGLPNRSTEHLLTGLLARHRATLVVDGKHRPLNENEGTAHEGLLVWASPGLDYPHPFDISPQAKSLSVLPDAGEGRDDYGRLAIELWALPMRPWPSPLRAGR